MKTITPPEPITITAFEPSSDESSISVDSNFIARQLARKLAAELDVTLGRAFTAHLGHDRWTLEEMRGRCHITHSGGVDTYHIDGTPVARLHPVEFSFEGLVVHAKRNVELLVRGGQ